MTRTVLAALIVSTFAASAMAANFGTPTAAAAGPAASAPVVATTAPAAGPQLGESFRIVKPDGATIIQQGKLGTNVLTGTAITVSDKDAFVAMNGKCAFNVKYDEMSAVAAVGTTNRLYSNDTLIAQNTKIDLVPGVLKTIWTQPYLVAGVNNVRVVVNADSAMPSTKWIRITVTGTCGGATAPAAAPAPAPAPAPTPVAAPVKPVVTPPPAPVVRYAPGTSEWNNLNIMWGYSNYATTQLKNANYARYAELVKLNAAITVAINAKTVEQGAYNSMVASWNTFVTEEKFKALMSAVTASTAGKK